MTTIPMSIDARYIKTTSPKLAIAPITGNVGKPGIR